MRVKCRPPQPVHPTDLGVDQQPKVLCSWRSTILDVIQGLVRRLKLTYQSHVQLQCRQYRDGQSTFLCGPPHLKHAIVGAPGFTPDIDRNPMWSGLRCRLLLACAAALPFWMRSSTPSGSYSDPLSSSEELLSASSAPPSPSAPAGLFVEARSLGCPRLAHARRRTASPVRTFPYDIRRLV